MIHFYGLAFSFGFSVEFITKSRIQSISFPTNGIYLLKGTKVEKRLNSLFWFLSFSVHLIISFLVLFLLSLFQLILHLTANSYSSLF